MRGRFEKRTYKVVVCIYGFKGEAFNERFFENLHHRQKNASPLRRNLRIYFWNMLELGLGDYERAFQETPLQKDC